MTAPSGDYKTNLTELLRAGGYTGGGQEYSPNLTELSKEVQRRVRALKSCQLEGIKLESDFYARVHELETEFQPLFDAIYEKRRKIVNGEYEPTDDECKLPLVHGLDPEELKKLEDNAPVEGKPSKGVPEFWFHALNNTAQISEMIFEYDIPVFKFLTDVTTKIHSEPSGFSLYFHFAENPYFENKVLEKHYQLNLQPDNDDVFDYDGPTVVKSQGTEIKWKNDKNITLKVVKKKQKKGSNAGRFITKTVTNDSFFNFFDPTVKTLSHDDEDPEAQESVRNDFEIGQLIRDQIIPRAVLFFTGEAAEEDDDFFDEEDGGDEDLSGDDDDED